MTKVSLSKTQIKILGGVGLGLVLFLFFWFGFFQPSRSKVGKLKLEWMNIESQLQEIEAITRGFGSPKEGLRQLNEKCEVMIRKFPSDEEDSIKLISDYAKKMNIEILSLTPAPKADYLDEGGNQVVVDSKVCAKVSISAEIRGSYQDLVQYMDGIEHSLPVLLTVEFIKINKEDAVTGKLKAILGLDIYLLR